MEATPSSAAEQERLQGNLWMIFSYDVSESIHLDKLRLLLGERISPQAPRFVHPMPSYVRFERPPVAETLSSLQLGECEAEAHARCQYYDYGVLSLQLQIPFSCDWHGLRERMLCWTNSADIEKQALDLARGAVSRSADALLRPNPNWLSESYFVIELGRLAGAAGENTPASDVLEAHRREIAQLVRGESELLSDDECQETLQGRLSYHQTDLLVVGWAGALLYDSPAGAQATLQLLEFANTQLLEFRYYDNLLSELLSSVYDLLDRKRSLLSRWRVSREAERLNKVRLDVMELTERIDNSIKFLSDTYYARLYRLAAARVGVADYRDLVEAKLKTISELYGFMVADFNETRMFVLELLVVVLILAEGLSLFRWK
jgi:hypothetical protein